MHNHDTGEAAYPLSGAMVAAMRDIAATECGAHFVPCVATARGLISRGFIIPALPGAPLAPRTLYRLTIKGHTALRIANNGHTSTNAAI